MSDEFAELDFWLLAFEGRKTLKQIRQHQSPLTVGSGDTKCQRCGTEWWSDTQGTCPFCGDDEAVIDLFTADHWDGEHNE